ncbi:hypothetical protein OUZ56_005303 [Daphnia magna]|uniref:Uncharacterized protein n=1 Tax=Daphnia magna TaxID=35525 RepID=A0ABQ9YSF3_9CRUS|nr:hypothetical protein OUZ56_005303 [Daphnia magna]
MTSGVNSLFRYVIAADPMWKQKEPIVASIGCPCAEKKRVNFHAPSECLSIDKRKGEQPIKFVLFFIAIDISKFLSNSFRHCNETKCGSGYKIYR